MQIEVEYYDIGEIQDNKLKFAVIVAQFKSEWIFVRHKERKTWEIPGGHREENEEIKDTASRELFEETGAKDFKLYPICVYSVNRDGLDSFGQLFYAEVMSLGSLPESEIGEVSCFEELPKNLTYQSIQPFLYQRTLEYLNKFKQKKSVNIRKANVNDAEKFLNMLKQLDTETKFMLFEPGERSITVEEIRNRLNREDFKALTLLVEDDGEVVGYLSADRGLFRRIKHSAYITVGLLKKYRGKKLGTKLFKEMESWARNNNITRLDLTVVESNEVAIGLYEKMGFKKEGLKERAMRVDGSYSNEYYMGKILD